MYMYSIAYVYLPTLYVLVSLLAVYALGNSFGYLKQRSPNIQCLYMNVSDFEHIRPCFEVLTIVPQRKYISVTLFQLVAT